MLRAILIAALLTGCATSPHDEADSSPELYGEVSLAWQIDSMTDHWLQTDREWQCSKNLQFHAEIGIEFDNDLR